MSKFKLELETNFNTTDERILPDTNGYTAIHHACNWLKTKTYSADMHYVVHIIKKDGRNKSEYYCSVYKLRNEFRKLTKTAEYRVDPITGRTISIITSTIKS